MTDTITLIQTDGKVARDQDPNLSAEQLQTLYRVMVTTRLMDERALTLQRQGRIGFYVQAMGQEASHIGAAFALRASDWVFPAYRQPGIMLLRGADLDDVINEWFANDGDICQGRQMPVHHSIRSIRFVSISSPIGTQISQATGAAMAAKLRKEDTAVMTFFGDGATSSNDFHCGLNFAGVFKAAVVFVCENNGWAISVPVRNQTASATIAAKAQAYGMPGVRVDGNDVLAVYRACREAVERARAGRGPTLVETVTYRIGSHSSSDDADRYRDKDEWEGWKKKDPIVRFQRYLQQKGVWSDAFDKATVEQAKTAINDAIKRAAARQPPAPQTLFDDVFMDVTPQLEEQRAQLLSLEGEADEEQGAFPL